MTKTTEDEPKKFSIKELFYDPANGLIGSNKIYNKIKDDYPEITYEEIREVLNNQEASQVFKRKKFVF